MGDQPNRRVIDHYWPAFKARDASVMQEMAHDDLVTVANPTVETVAAALRTAVPTLDPDEQRLALELYRMLLAGEAIWPAALAATAGVDVREVEAALERWPGVYRDRKGRIVGSDPIVAAGRTNGLPILYPWSGRPSPVSQRS